MNQPLKALSLWRPWPWVILHGIPGAPRKLIENRDWPLPKAMLGVPFLIHAGKTWDKAGEDFIRRRLGILGLPREAWQEGLVGRTVVTRVITSAADAPPGQAPWFFGEYGFVLDDARTVAIEPIPCRGALGFWRVPEELVSRVVELRRAA